MNYSRLLVVLIFGACAVTSLTAQTLQDRARRSAPSPVFVDRTRELVPQTFAAWLRDADVVVRGRLKIVRTYLSPDQTELYTDYEVAPAQVLYERAAQTSSPSRGARVFTFWVWGGRTTLEGVDVIVRDHQMPPLNERAELVLYLAEDETAKGRYRLASVTTGILEVPDGRIRLEGEGGAYGAGFDALRGLPIEQLAGLMTKLRLQR